MTEKERNYISEGQRSYEEWRDNLLADPEHRRIYEEEADKMKLWLQLVEARMYGAKLSQEELAKKLGTTKQQVVRIEKNPYSYRLNTLDRYIKALGEGFSLEINIRRPDLGKKQT